MRQSMYIAEWVDGEWRQGELRPYGPLPMLPSAQVLNYGQAAFEGMKAQRSAKGRIVLFRCAGWGLGRGFQGWGRSRAAARAR